MDRRSSDGHDFRRQPEREQAAFGDATWLEPGPDETPSRIALPEDSGRGYEGDHSPRGDARPGEAVGGNRLSHQFAQWSESPRCAAPVRRAAARSLGGYRLS